MYEFMTQNQLYIVLCITLLTWAGVVLYLVRLDKKVQQLEKQMKKSD